MESDRTFILNTIAGQSVDDAVLDGHAHYDKLNNVLRGIFVAPALERIIKEKDVSTITQCLDIVKASNTSIIDLDLKDCSTFDDDILTKLADSLPLTLTELKLVSTGSKVTVNGINACLGKILGCPQLVRLYLSWIIIDDVGAEAIADALNVNHSLRILEMGYNNIGDDGAKAIADGLKDNESLDELVLLYGNNIGDDGAKAIADGRKDIHRCNGSYVRSYIDADGKEYLKNVFS